MATIESSNVYNENNGRRIRKVTNHSVEESSIIATNADRGQHLCGGIYTGDWDFDFQLPQGKGSMIYHQTDASQEVESYDGDWKNGLWHGKGTLHFVNGDVYFGNFWEGYRHDPENESESTSTYIWKDGRTYCGPFSYNVRHGEKLANYTWPDGSYYKGFFFQGKRHGPNGFYQFANGNSYRGNWSYGHYDGYGVFTWADGRVYKGEWTRSKRHGHGIQYDLVLRDDGSEVLVASHDGIWYEHEPVERNFVEEKQEPENQLEQIHAIPAHISRSRGDRSARSSYGDIHNTNIPELSGTATATPQYSQRLSKSAQRQQKLFNKINQEREQQQPSQTNEIEDNMQFNSTSTRASSGPRVLRPKNNETNHRHCTSSLEADQHSSLSKMANGLKKAPSSRRPASSWDHLTLLRPPTIGRNE